MPIVSIINQKGGAGKTTIAVNLAHALKRDGYNVLLVDSDPQGSSRDWHEANGAQLLTVVGLDRDTLDKDVKMIQANFDWIVIDGAPRFDKLAAAAVKASDIILIPCQPSPYDIWAAGDLVDLIKARQTVMNGLPYAAFVVSRAIKNTKLGSEVMNALQAYELPVFKSMTTQRVAYPTTAAEGKTVFDNQDSEAAQEVTQIKNELLAIGK